MNTQEIHQALEIVHNRTTRIFEIIPGLSAWIFLLSPILLSLVWPVIVAYIIIAYDLLWLTKAFGLSYRLIRGYRRLHRTDSADWRARLDDLNRLPAAINQVGGRIKNRQPGREKLELRLYSRQLEEIQKQGHDVLDPNLLHHAVII